MVVGFKIRVKDKVSFKYIKKEGILDPWQESDQVSKNKGKMEFPSKKEKIININLIENQISFFLDFLGI